MDDNVINLRRAKRIIGHEKLLELLRAFDDETQELEDATFYVAMKMTWCLLLIKGVIDLDEMKRLEDAISNKGGAAAVYELIFEMAKEQ